MPSPCRCLLLLAIVCLPACQQKMATQPSVRPDQASDFFADGRGNRPAVPGTVARGHLHVDTHLFTGLKSPAANDLAIWTGVLGTASTTPLVAASGALGAEETRRVVDAFPFPITREVLEHGCERYMIYCVVCHDPLGTGHGMIVQRGYTPPPSLHIDRLRAAPVGHFFDVMTNGYGSMPQYREQIPPRDRWAIAAYVRALQLSQRFPESDLTQAMRKERTEQTAAGGTP